MPWLTAPSPPPVTPPASPFQTHASPAPFIPFFLCYVPLSYILPLPSSQVFRNDVDEVEDMRSPPEREQMSHASRATLRDVRACGGFCAVTGSVLWLKGKAGALLPKGN